MSIFSKIVDEVKFVIQNPAVVRKAIVATATTVVADITAFQAVLPHVPAQVSVAVSAVNTIAVFLVTYLTPNKPTPPAVK